MDDYTAATYGERIADVYDGFYAHKTLDSGPTVDFLAELAGPGPALELGVGTGRIALPLAERGVEVQGIDASEAMVARLRAKPGGDEVRVTIGSFADFALEDRFPLVFVVFNTFFALTSPEEQGRCFRAVARHLTPGGAFVIEAFVPDLSRFDRGQRVQATEIGLDEVRLDVSLHDAEAQVVESQHMVIREDGVRLIPIRARYAWPSELDLMAELAGLRFRERWGGWGREPFAGSSQNHISVWESPAG